MYTHVHASIDCSCTVDFRKEYDKSVHQSMKQIHQHMEVAIRDVFINVTVGNISIKLTKR
jgi:hypothetical protein